MKHIHLVNPYGSVAMQRMAMPLLNELPALYYVSHGTEINENADLNYHIPWHTLFNHENKGEGKHAILYTHVNPPAIPHLINACERADLIICMTFTGRNELLDLGVDPNKIWCIYSAADQFQFRKRNIGIIGFAQPNGRKRQNLILDVAWRYDLSLFHFIFAGDAWKPVVEVANSLGVSAQTVGPVNDNQMRELYNKLDLLLVTGYVEGGPLPILEAMTSGVKVISPKFGYAADLLPPEQIYGSVDELIDILADHVANDVENHMLVQSWTWQHYAAEHALIFGRLLGESVDLFPNHGASRYAQLLDIIDEIKPSSIVEIGTWNGHNARRMIQEAYRYNPGIKYQGFDLFEEQTGAQLRNELSKAAWPKNVVNRILNATRANIDLVAGNTRKTLYKKCMPADLYFIDGGHSEKTIKSDWVHVSMMMRQKPDSVVVFDDYYTAGKPEGMGCNKIIDDLFLPYNRKYHVEILPIETIAENGRKIKMVKVTKHAGIHLQVQEQPSKNEKLRNDAAALEDRLSDLFRRHAA